MDLYCPTCGEPWDNDSLHEEAEGKEASYSDVLADFRREGCMAFGSQHRPTANRDRAMASSALFDLMPDDPDGVAAMMEDHFG